MCSRCVTPDRSAHFELAQQHFGEQKISTHPVPDYMEAGEIPRYICGIMLKHVFSHYKKMYVHYSFYLKKRKKGP